MRILADEVEVGFIVEGAKINKVLRFNRRVFVVVHFYFIRNSFLLFYFHYFFNASFVDQQYFSSLVRIINSLSKTLLYLCMAIRKVLSSLHSW